MDNLSQEDMNKVKHVIRLGVTTKQEVKDLNDGFKETFNDVCKELDLDKKLIRKAISVSFKASQKGDKNQIVDAEREEIEEVAQLLNSIGTI
jgi:hypothetical protein